ncbi:unnamed protein product [Hydatigera taeniaeformis]|uniref:PGG domain-containing protein n=1 Tax=Hydatigena taeniaeformis TaxID=6205 RepID=A0A0R3WNA8_HYDTA|nr:unnamed protein product [Hydatigera taeniaeformis]
MDDPDFHQFVYIQPKPGIKFNVSRELPSLAAQACRNLQKVFSKRRGKALDNGDVIKLTCIALAIPILVDILCTLCTRKAKHYGISGSVFLPVNFALIHTIFVVLLLEFRTKAPGAPTIASFVGHRFGVVTHILTITISLITSLYILTVNITDGTMVLLAVTRDVSRTATVSIVFLLVGVMLVVARRRSHAFILYIITTIVLAICAFLVFIVLNVSAYAPLGTFPLWFNPFLSLKVKHFGYLGVLYRKLSSKEVETGETADGFAIISHRSCDHNRKNSSRSKAEKVEFHKDL